MHLMLAAADCRFESVADFVERCGGTRVIESVLIANNGIAAVKCIRYTRCTVLIISIEHISHCGNH